VDPLSEVLDLLDLRAASPSRLEAGGRWALGFAGHQHLKVGTVVAGECWLVPDGAAPLHLGAGDCYLLASGRPFTASSDLDTAPIPNRTALPSPWPSTTYYQTAPDDPARTILISGSLSLDDIAAALLLDNLPPSVHIAADSRRAADLRPILHLLSQETAADEPGASTIRSQLTHILFVQVLRTLLASNSSPDGVTPGWLGALGDRQIGAAVALLHRHPARRWTVADLAAAVNMSRSSFAERFRALVGVPPLDYLVRWRIHTAARALRSTDRTVAVIAADAGYASVSAFSNAFKRVLGQAPARYRSHPRAA
jgi:AraC-like DNA-binding protein